MTTNLSTAAGAAGVTNLPTDYQNFIAKSRYARFLDHEGRREHWDETVTRYFDYFEADLDRRHGYKVPATLRSELYDAVVNLHVMPSMRALMTAGPALERENLAGYNCFAGDEKFITKQGMRSFAETLDEPVDVLCSDGQWRPAIVKSFGKQTLQAVTFRPGSGRSMIRHTFKVTKDHRWLTQRGEVTDLRVGDKVPSQVATDHEFIAEAFVRGFGFGDGTITNKGTAFIRLCGNKAEHADVFASVGGTVSYYEYFQGDAAVRFGRGKFEDWKELPYEHLDNPAYLASWLKGYLAADGNNWAKQPTLSSQDWDAIAFVEEIAPLCGKIITGRNVSKVLETNYGKRSAPLVTLTIRDSVEFTVVGIEELDEDEVFCVVEPITKTFTLQHGVVTGNCSYVPIDRPRAFAEVLYILMCGTGVGFSVERQIIAKLPAVPAEFSRTSFDIVVGDSKLGWAEAFETLVTCLYAGTVPHIDYSLIRPAGERLKVFGGRASGPEPLRQLFEFTIRMFRNAAGRRLNSLEVHEIVTKTGEVVVVGGVRRSAEISLSNLSDQRMRDAKSGNWWEAKPHLALANNSAAYTEKPDVGSFMDEWSALYRSKSGERGIFNRAGAVEKILRLGRREHEFEFGTNPCVTGDTPLLTDKGYRPIRDLVGQSVRVWNGKQWSEVTPFSTGVNPLCRVELSDGTELTCTPYHRFVVEGGQKVEARHLGRGQYLESFDMPAEAGEDKYANGPISVVGITYLDRTEETFCVTEPLNGTATFAGIVTGNCGEIILRPRGLCNLSEVVARTSDSSADLKDKARLAAIIGTWQSTQTTFNFVEPEWQINAEQERLLGVSMTGIFDNALLRGDHGLDKLGRSLEGLKSAAIKANRLEARQIGVEASVAVTCVKPSGTVSQLVDSRSGIHPGHAEYYIRRVRGDNKDPITKFMRDSGIPAEPCVNKPDEVTVFSFPMKAEGTVTRDAVSAIRHLELVKVYNRHWAEHAVSCTVSVREQEWPAVGGWVYDNFDDVIGLSFLPYFEDNSTYAQMPYETITREQYEQMVAAAPASVDWQGLGRYEAGIDTVNGTRELACTGNTCEIVDLTAR